MNEQMEETIVKYERRLDSLKGFNPCTTCCEMSVVNSEILILEELLVDLKDLQEFYDTTQ